jgi:hypothetical protein
MIINCLIVSSNYRHETSSNNRQHVTDSKQPDDSRTQYTNVAGALIRITYFPLEKTG